MTSTYTFILFLLPLNMHQATNDALHFINNLLFYTIKYPQDFNSMTYLLRNSFGGSMVTLDQTPILTICNEIVGLGKPG